MTISSSLFPNLIDHKEGVDLFYESLRSSLLDSLASNTGVTLNKTLSGAVIRLHNKGTRPTVYEISVTRDKYNQANHVVLDTIVNEQKPSHEMLKTSFSFSKASHIINIALRLSQQQCDGSKELTLSRYQPLGLLYAVRKSSPNKQKADS